MRNGTSGDPTWQIEDDQKRAGDLLVKSGLKLNHLRLIVAIEDQGQISAAAEAMNMSQPAASRMLSEMEAIIKAPLCERVPRGVALTGIGAALARRARSVLLEIREASREIADLKTGFGGTVTLGAVTAPAISLAVPAILKAGSAHPGIEFNMNIETSNLLARNLLAARYDFVIGRIPDDLNPRLFNAREIGVEKACIIARAGHPLLAKRVASLSDLAPGVWVFQPEGSLLRRTVEHMFIAANVRLPERIVNTPSILLTMALICKSDAVAPVASDVAVFIASQSAVGDKIVILPTDFDIVTAPYSIITARGRALPPSARLLYDMILDEAPG
jgi:molybdate transport repressor ModE-like protein